MVSSSHCVGGEKGEGSPLNVGFTTARCDWGLSREGGAPTNGELPNQAHGHQLFYISKLL
jgi:hypothetical protein